MNVLYVPSHSKELGEKQTLVPRWATETWIVSDMMAWLGGVGFLCFAIAYFFLNYLGFFPPSWTKMVPGLWCLALSTIFAVLGFFLQCCTERLAGIKDEDHVERSYREHNERERLEREWYGNGIVCFSERYRRTEAFVICCGNRETFETYMTEIRRFKDESDYVIDESNMTIRKKVPPYFGGWDIHGRMIVKREYSVEWDRYGNMIVKPK